MAEQKTDLEALLGLAEKCEREYDWRKAAEDYQSILESMPSHEPEKIGAMLERRAFALYKAALQAESIDEFHETAESASKAYSEAQHLLEKGSSGESDAKARRCQAMLALLGFHRSTTADERIETATKSYTMAKEALAGFEQNGNAHECMKTFNDLASSAVIYTELVPDHATRVKVFEEMMDAGKKALESSQGIEKSQEMVRTLVIASCLYTRAGHHGLTNRDYRTCITKGLNYWKEAESLSRTGALAELPFAALVGDAAVDTLSGMEGALHTFLEALDIARDSRDRFMIGNAFLGLSFYADWLANAEQTTEEMSSSRKQALDYAVEARSEFSKIGFISARGANMWVESPDASFHEAMAFWENDLEVKREHSQKALQAVTELSRLAVRSGYVSKIGGSLAIRGHVLSMLAETESDVERKRRLLEDAIDPLRAGIEIIGRWDAGAQLNAGVQRWILSRIQGNLAPLAANEESRITGFKEAIESSKTAFEIWEQGISREQVESDSSIVRRSALERRNLGNLYDALSELTSSKETTRAAIECFEKSAEIDSDTGSPGRAAESLWQAGRLYDRLEDHESAADRFLSASAEYKRGAEKIPSLKSLYSDYAAYLDAWAEFERAKHDHIRQEYTQAVDHFKKAAAFCESLPKWRFLASNYHAWALLDEGESASREDHPKEAARFFKQAAELFQKSGAALDEARSDAENADEKKMIDRLLSVSAGRCQYCNARAEIERARDMDLEGKHSLSCKVYGRAADDLEELAKSAPSEQDNREMRLIATISRAWQSMTSAEATFSPESYEDAARLFEEAKDLTDDPRTKALTLGHSRFCRALEAGVKFTDSRDEAMHDTAAKHLESASGYYLRAGSDACSEYARASRLLFDAHALLDEAVKHKDRKNAAKAYTLADEVLKASAESFEKAGQKAKTEQVHKLRERVKKEKELAVSLMHVLEAPSNMSSTTVFTALTPTQETAAGLDRFVHADVQATVIARPVTLNVGDEFKLEIELVNAGNGVAQLTKLEEIIPSGFEIKEVPERYRLEGNYLNMRGRRLDALKTEDIKVVMKPAAKGHFRLRPRILYLDDAGRYRSHEPEPVEVTVKELGISGWLKGIDSKG